ncbi:Haem-NO-binding [Jannaschia faecimaris]|uniref:Haem-NO-binding n=1 Tax=Jannaschia faecimaris TaxID=1244108 RepID=A0A1H3QMF2_9RHOB|nr:heme NO-binding domain-containing protein [Jannaschia faecimaris]SDZ14490.1 Haem-NO-binding [Jannaschia faecimaris]
MHGLICKSLEAFVRDQHGEDTWHRIVQASDLPYPRFEALRSYDDDLMTRVFDMASRELGRSFAAPLEDIGHWICTHPPLEAVRRLIRFSGTCFVDLIYALDEVHDRARIALPGLGLPKFTVTELAPNDFFIISVWHLRGGGAFLTGVLRAMADDYGALALIDAGDRRKVDGKWHETLTVRIFDQAHHKPREFMLSDIS